MLHKHVKPYTRQLYKQNNQEKIMISVRCLAKHGTLKISLPFCHLNS